MVLVDTSVWIDFLRGAPTAQVAMLEGLLEGDDLGLYRHSVLPGCQMGVSNGAVCISREGRRQADLSIAKAGSLSGCATMSPGRCSAFSWMIRASSG